MKLSSGDMYRVYMRHYEVWIKTWVPFPRYFISYKQISTKIGRNQKDSWGQTLQEGQLTLDTTHLILSTL